MEKTLLLIPVLLILVLVIVAIYFVAVKHLHKRQTTSRTEKSAEISHQEQICPQCKVGKESYERDKHSTTCPYILCWKDGECQYYVPFNNRNEEM